MNDWFFRALFPLKVGYISLLEAKCKDLQTRLDSTSDKLAVATVQLESLKNKIVKRAKVEPTIKAKSAAEIRRVVEANNEREFEEQTHGL